MRRDTPVGHVLAAEDLAYRELPTWLVAPEHFSDASSVIGRTTTEPLFAGEYLRAERVTGSAEPFRDLPSCDDCPEEDGVLAIFAARELPPGTEITEDDLLAVESPPVYIPVGVFLSPEYVVGRTVCTRIMVGEFVSGRRVDRDGVCPPAGASPASD